MLLHVNPKLVPLSLQVELLLVKLVEVLPIDAHLPLVRPLVLLLLMISQWPVPMAICRTMPDALDPMMLPSIAFGINQQVHAQM